MLPRLPLEAVSAHGHDGRLGRVGRRTQRFEEGVSRDLTFSLGHLGERQVTLSKR